jgi:ribosomal protein S12 methylthiotransferase
MSAKIGFIALGCPKATVDAERILSRLRAEEYQLTPDYHDAEVVIVNTCGFIDEAVAESLDAIGEALQENGKVIVTGCLGAQAELIRAKYPDVLAVTGPAALEEVMQAVHEHVPAAHDPYLHLLPPGGIKLTPRHYAYIKIAEGCNQRCTFCVIPSMRGVLRSRAPGEIMDEAESLVKAGVKELLIVAQDTAAYGVDVKYRAGFWRGAPLKSRITDLARALGQLGVWVRLHYVYPYPHVDELVELMAEGVILPYLDVPLQHASAKILKSMKRPADSENMLRRIEQWRKICPELVLRSTFIVGFPGETGRDFEDLLEFIEAAQLDRVGAFMYSPVEGATANALPNPVPPRTQRARLETFMEAQAEISAAKLQKRVGETLTVLVDECVAGGAYARSAGEAPEIDGVVAIEDERAVKVGEFVQVEITAADEHDLYARLIL